MAGPIDDVREGMKVRDTAGDEIGRVSFVKLSDPDVVTPAGQEPEPAATPVAAPPGAGAGRGTPGVGGAPPLAGGIFAVGAATGLEPDVPDEFAERLKRTGYVKIGKGLFRRDLYVGADQIERVADDEVVLKTGKDDLVRET